MKFEEAEVLCMLSRRGQKMVVNETDNETWFISYMGHGKKISTIKVFQILKLQFE